MLTAAGVDEDAAAVASAEEEDRFLDRAAIEGMAVHLWESNTIRNVSTDVPTVCKPDTLATHTPCYFQIYTFRMMISTPQVAAMQGRETDNSREEDYMQRRKNYD